MHIVLILVALGFILISGRNDGAPLVSVPLQRSYAFGAFAMFCLVLALPLIPWLGFWGVAESLQTMLGSMGTNPATAAALLGGVMLTVGVSTAFGIPTSITLALVGGLTGAAIANRSPVDVSLLVRVISLGLLAPFVAALMAFLLSKIPLTPPKGMLPGDFLRLLRKLTFPILAVAYAANDGQKILFVTALVLGTGIGPVASSFGPVTISALIFLLGTISGLRKSGKFVRHGITRVRPITLLWTEVSTAITVIAGASLGIPLSMTQSLTGALLGTGAARSRRSVYWDSLPRVGAAWIWTLPVSAIVSGTIVYFVA